MEAEQELKRKRERGRQAQAAFRKRQAKAAQSAQEENSQLREAIESIVKAASRSDRPELLSVIRHAAVAAGVEAKHLEVSAASDVGLSTNEGVDGGSYGSFDNAHDTTLGSALINFGASKSLAVPSFTWSKAYKPPLTMGNFWFDPLRSTNITTTPDDVVPYVGQGRYTLGGLLFWGVLDHVTNACTHTHNPKSCEELQIVLHHSRSHSKSLSKVGPEFIHTMGKGRQHCLQGGRSDGIHAMATERSSIAATRQIVDDDHASEGTDTSAWLLPKDVEGRVRQRLGQEIFGHLENAAKAPESSQAHRALRETIHKMVDAFMCFGNGPSWTGNYVDLIFSEWAALEAHRC